MSVGVGVNNVDVCGDVTVREKRVNWNGGGNVVDSWRSSASSVVASAGGRKVVWSVHGVRVETCSGEYKCIACPFGGGLGTLGVDRKAVSEDCCPPDVFRGALLDILRRSDVLDIEPSVETSRSRRVDCATEGWRAESIASLVSVSRTSSPSFSLYSWVATGFGLEDLGAKKDSFRRFFGGGGIAVRGLSIRGGNAAQWIVLFFSGDSGM